MCVIIIVDFGVKHQRFWLCGLACQTEMGNAYYCIAEPFIGCQVSVKSNVSNMQTFTKPRDQKNTFRAKNNSCLCAVTCVSEKKTSLSVLAVWHSFIQK